MTVKNHHGEDDVQPGRNGERPADEVKRLLEQRSQLHVLLAENPNYFGNLGDSGLEPKFEIINDTYFEQVTCVALNPDVDVLEATVQIKRPLGYGGDLCSNGSTEWVRFYISYDEGATWEDVGLGSFNAHDIPDGVDCGKNKTKPLVYTVAFPLTEPHRNRCSKPVLPLVRAILSWQVQPPASQPNWPPIWGNHLDHHVQLRPRRLILRDLLDSLELDLKAVPKYWQALLPHPLPEPDPAPFSLIEAASLAEQSRVPAHRFAAPLLAQLVSEKSVSQQGNLTTISELADIGVNWSEVLTAFLDNQGDTTYEQLNCLGLDHNRDLLVGTFSIKLSSGFAGPPCSAGSVEYVSFWVDYDNKCEWTYLNTAKVSVHDYNPIPADGLHYWVAVPAKTADYARTCKEPKVGRIRAVLSWSTPPSTTNPYDLPRWGNAIETHIEIRPRVPISEVPAIGTLGGIHIVDIDTGGTGLTLPGKTFAHWGSPADPWLNSRPCPFGGTIEATVPVPPSFAAAGRKYRLLWRPDGSSATGTPIIDPYNTDNISVTTTRYPDPLTGLTPYLDPSQNIYSVLGTWQTRGVVVDGVYEIRLEMTDAASNPIGSTSWYKVRVDNTKPDADITLTGGTPCNKATPGDTVTGTFKATDAYFGAYSLDTLPASLNPPDPSHIPVSTTVPVPSGSWSLVTDGTWAQCGYVVQLWVYDRAIVDSVPWSGHNVGYDDVGFCLGL
jgi:hypothetical protein